MHKTIQNLISIEEKIKLRLKEKKINKLPEIIAVSKTFQIEKIYPLIAHGHLNFGENKVQEAMNKWKTVKENNPKINLHLIGKLQTNKVKIAIKIFDFIHTVDSIKLAKKISDEQNKIKKNIKIFIQVNIGEEVQKSGIMKNKLDELVNYCKELNLNVIGLMCIPPIHGKTENYFKDLENLNSKYNLSELSMGMSSDYLLAIMNSSTYVRIGSSIFGSRD
ncbi:YggS family pyridoxal phosphate-dependent enzyme [Candidatus Pelagibacter communis]|uniref:YggS family pyridoxal phosphate-dependent enzyme n=1 Tax=Pelagibacter ubique TaxID=198252 RepID=UPI00094D5198|nr:YggS family pyridoxal phosphate-dependent enzyme [Candidatus Pelagibacter ubique]